MSDDTENFDQEQHEEEANESNNDATSREANESYQDTNSSAESSDDSKDESDSATWPSKKRAPHKVRTPGWPDTHSYNGCEIFSKRAKKQSQQSTLESAKKASEKQRLKTAQERAKVDRTNILTPAKKQLKKKTQKKN